MHYTDLNCSTLHCTTYTCFLGHTAVSTSSGEQKKQPFKARKRWQSLALPVVTRYIVLLIKQYNKWLASKAMWAMIQSFVMSGYIASLIISIVLFCWLWAGLACVTVLGWLCDPCDPGLFAFTCKKMALLQVTIPREWASNLNHIPEYGRLY